MSDRLTATVTDHPDDALASTATIGHISSLTLNGQTYTPQEVVRALQIYAVIGETTRAAFESLNPDAQPKGVRVCPKRDAVCPHGHSCPYSIDRYECRDEPKEPG